LSPLRTLALADVAALCAVFMVSWPLLHEPRPADRTTWAWVLLVAALPAWVAAAAALGQYDAPRGGPRPTRIEVLGVAHLASFGAWFVAVLSPYTGEIDPDIPNLLAVWLLTIACVVLARALAIGGGRLSRQSHQDSPIG
jgi:cobalamin synthase